MMRNTMGLAAIAILATILACAASLGWAENAAPASTAQAGPGADAANPQAKAAVQQYVTGPSVFVQNAGQWTDTSIKYALDGMGANVGLTDKGPKFQLFRKTSVPSEGSVGSDGSPAPGKTGPVPAEMHEFSLVFDGAAQVTPAGRGQSDRKFNYMLGDVANHREGVPSFDAVWYENLYSGVSLELKGRRTGLKYNFHVAPGADVRAIRLRYEGVEGLSVAADGSLDIRVVEGWENLKDGVPYIYQEVNGSKRPVAGRFILFDDHTYGFEITGAYDATLPIVIDPEVGWSTYLGGTSDDRGYGAAIDSSGNVYATGYTLSTGWVIGWDTGQSGGPDAFVVKLNATGTHVWSTYLGGANEEYGWGVAVDSGGNVYATGYTGTSGWLPAATGWKPTFNGGTYDGYLVKLDAAGTPVWSTYIGGTGNDDCYSLAVDSSGNSYISGSTASNTGFIPTSGNTGWIKTYVGGAYDGFVVKLGPTGAHVWSTYLGGSAEDHGTGIAVDSSGRTYTTGSTNSSSVWVSGGFNLTFNGGFWDGFTVALDAAGAHRWSTYLGGTVLDIGYSIGVDSSGNSYVTGYTNSSGWVSGGWDTSFNGASDGYVMKLSAAGGHLWSTYVGGSGDETPLGMAVDPSGNGYITGYTASSGWVNGGWDVTFNGGTYDGFVAKFSTAGAHLWSTYLGGTADDQGWGIAVDAGGNAAVTGSTKSSGWISGGWINTYGGGTSDGFLLKISNTVGGLQVTLTPPEAAAAGAQWRRVGTSTWFNSGATEANVPSGIWTVEYKDTYGWRTPTARTVTVPSGGTATDTAAYASADVGLYWSTYLGGSGDDGGSGIAADSSGNVYATGYTNSSGWVSGGLDVSQNGAYDAYVVKLSPTGAHVWSTYLGGTNEDRGNGVAVDGSGNVYMAGKSLSDWGISGGFNTTRSGSVDGILVKLSPTGAHLWSTYIGGTSPDEACGVAVDSSGNAYVAGNTNSAGWATLHSLSGGYDAFVIKIAAAGGPSSHLWSRYIGSASNDFGWGIAVDSGGNTYTTGGTYSSGWTGGGWDPTFNGTTDGFVMKLDAVGSPLWSTYLGGDADEKGYGIAVDSSGNCYATGETSSPTRWVSSGGWNPNPQGYDGYVVKLSTTGSHLWSTYLGGAGYDRGFGIAVDSSGNCYATGETSPSGWVSGGWDTNHNGGVADVYVVKLNTAGAHIWSAFLGGTEADYGQGIALDTAANIWLTGLTNSSGWTGGGWQTTYGGGTSDAFVVKLQEVPGSLQVTLSPPEAVAAGAQWRRKGTSTWFNSGDTETDVPPVQLQIEYKAIAGWETPDPHTVTVTSRATTQDTATYVAYASGLSWSTYLGGTGDDYGLGIATDAAGNAYATGYTASAGWVPVSGNTGWDKTQSGGHDAYAVKLSATGAHVWSTYLGGANLEQGNGIAVDSSGNVYVAGVSFSSGWGVIGGFDPGQSGSGDGFLVKLNATGGFLWATYICGANDDGATGVATDSAGNAYVSGYSASSGWASGSGWDTVHSGGYDGFVIKVAAAGGGASHLWSSYMGGANADHSWGIAVDSSGYVYAVGSTNSSGWVPLGGNSGWKTVYEGSTDGYVVKFSSAGAHVWSTYLGGSGTDNGNTIAVDSAGNPCATGQTASAGWVSGGWDTTYSGSGVDGYVVKLSAAGPHLWSTYLGDAASSEEGRGIAVDSSGNVYVTGSSGAGAAWAINGFDTTQNGGNDAFIVKLSSAGLHYWSSYLGGTGDDFGFGIAIGPLRNVWVTGYTNSSTGWVSGGWLPTYGGGTYDAFVSKIVETVVPVAPSNPGSTAIGPNTITWTWQDNSSDETGFKVYDDPGTGPPTTLQTTTAASVVSWPHGGLSVNAQYAFQVAGTNIAGDGAKTTNYTAWTLIEAVSNLSLTVRTDWLGISSTNTPSNLASGSSGLYLENTTAGTNSGWQQANTMWVSSGLAPNTSYALRGRSRNGAGVETTPRTTSIYTHAADPVAPVLNNPAVHSLDVAIGSGDGNPAYTVYSIEVSPAVGGNVWVQADGSVGAAAVFQTAALWGAKTVTGLAEFTSYTFRARARNVDLIPSDSSSPWAGGTTRDGTPPTGSVVINGGAAYATSPTVTLALAASDTGVGVADMQFSNDNATWSGWETYGPTKNWALAGGDGVKTVYAQYRDGHGNVSTGTISDDITFDATPPTPVITGSNTLTNTTRTLTIAFGEHVNGFSLPSGVSVTNGTASNLQVTGTPGTYTVDVLGSGTNTVSVSVPAGTTTDDATNPNIATAAPFTFPFDGVAPTASITLDDPTPTGIDVVHFSVDFSESVGTSFDASDVTVTGTVPGTKAVSGTDPNYTVTLTLSNPDGDGTVGISVGTGVTDLAGNAYAGGSSSMYTIANWPGFTTQPQDAMKYTGDTHTFVVAIGAGSGTASYQWKWDDGLKAVHNGPTTSTWALTNLTTANRGDYWCEVTYNGQTYPTIHATLDVQDHLSITLQPEGGTKNFGESYTFTVGTIGGYVPLFYQWKKDGNDIPNATDVSFAIASLNSGHSGVYTVEITDSNADLRVSDAAQLTVTQGVPVTGTVGLGLLLTACAYCSVRAIRRRQ